MELAVTAFRLMAPALQVPSRTGRGRCRQVSKPPARSTLRWLGGWLSGLPEVLHVTLSEPGAGGVVAASAGAPPCPHGPRRLDESASGELGDQPPGVVGCLLLREVPGRRHQAMVDADQASSPEPLHVGTDLTALLLPTQVQDGRPHPLPTSSLLILHSVLGEGAVPVEASSQRA